MNDDKTNVFSEEDTIDKSSSHTKVYDESSGELIEVTGSDKRKLAGLLISFSGNPLGEVWQLKIGENSVGRNQNSHVHLAEASVSKIHANIKINHLNGVLKYVAQVKTPSGFLAINKTDIPDSAELTDGDILSVGGYELKFVKMNSDELGLKPNPNFQKDNAKSVGGKTNDQGWDYSSNDSTRVRE